jgi:cellulose synthase operon protein YhjQ
VKTIAVVSAKGGVGRTTLCANLGAALSRQGRAVLSLDMDPQNAIGLHTGLPIGATDGLARATLANRDWLSACVETSDALVLPHGVLDEADQAAFEVRLLAEPELLKQKLAGMGLADDALVIIDAASGPSAYLRQALIAADLVLVVTLPDAASYATLPVTTRLVETHCSARADFVGTSYVINQVDNSRGLGKDVMRVLLGTLGSHISQVHRDESVCEAMASQQLVLDYEPTSMATRDIDACALLLSERLPSTLKETQ